MQNNSKIIEKKVEKLGLEVPITTIFSLLLIFNYYEESAKAYTNRSLLKPTSNKGKGEASINVVLE